MRILLILSCLGTLLFMVFQLGCDHSGGGGYSSGAPQRQVPIVRDMGVVETNAVISMRDVGFSAMYGGKSVWIFGDTFLNAQNAEDTRLMSSSWSYTYDVDAGDGIFGLEERVDAIGAPEIFFPFTDSEKNFNQKHYGANCEQEPCGDRWAIWPGTIVTDQDRGWAYVFYHKIKVKEGLLNFIEAGHSFAVWKNVADPVERPIFDFYEEDPSLFFSRHEIGFGSAALVEDGLVYIYGCDHERGTLVQACRLAKVPLEEISDKTAWLFYNGKRNWSRNSNDAAIVFDGNQMMTVSYNAFLEKYIAIYSGPLGTEVMLRSSESPEGPWSIPEVLFTAQSPDSPTGWIYDALAHPEYTQENGRIIYITYTKQIAKLHSEMRLVSVEFMFKH